MVGMTATHRKGHVCRAALEAAAYQAREVFDAIYADSKVVLKSLKVDGGGTHNKFLMQFQSDIINVPVVKPVVMETTSMGAAFAAGLAVGVWKDLKEIRQLWSVAETFKPKMSSREREKNWSGWKKAVTKSLDWISDDEEEEDFEDALQHDHEMGGSKRSILFGASSSSIGDTKYDFTDKDRYTQASMVFMAAGAVAAGFLLGQRSRS